MTVFETFFICVEIIHYSLFQRLRWHLIRFSEFGHGSFKSAGEENEIASFSDHA